LPRICTLVPAARLPFSTRRSSDVDHGRKHRILHRVPGGFDLVGLTEDACGVQCRGEDVEEYETGHILEEAATAPVGDEDDRRRQREQYAEVEKAVGDHVSVVLTFPGHRLVRTGKKKSETGGPTQGVGCVFPTGSDSGEDQAIEWSVLAALSPWTGRPRCGTSSPRCGTRRVGPAARSRDTGW